MGEYRAVKFVPKNLLTKRFKCTNCKSLFAPDWLKPRGFPMGSIEAQEGGYWVRLTAQERCPSCSQYVEISLPVVERKARVLLFGDEAARPLNNGDGALLYTYSLVGTSNPFIADIESEIRELKRGLCPEIDELVGGIGEIIRGADNKLFKYNIVLAGQPQNPNEKREFEDYVQREAYILLLMQVIDNVTGMGGQPVINLDSQKSSKANTIIHQWARDAFQHGQGNLLYSFLTHSIFVPAPVFVPPASHPLLEVADFMSFAVARHHYRVFYGAAPEIDLKILGDVMYTTFSDDGEELLFQSSVGYPWQLNFPNTAG